MARSLRIEYPGAWYHVTCRGNERRAIFADDEDRRRFLRTLKECADAGRVEVHAFVLMENHFHLLVMTPEANLHRFMQRFNTAYTVGFNRRHARSGHLYQGRYKALLVDADGYLLELSRYIHLNPVRTNESSTLNTTGKIKMLNQYRWSSLRDYTAGGNRNPFLKTYKILEMVGGVDLRARRNRYATFVREGIAKERSESLWNEVHGQTVLGSSSFVDWVRQKFLSDREADRGEIPALKSLGRRRHTDMETIARTVASFFKIEAADLFRPYASYRQARSVFLELSCLYLSPSMSLAEIGRAAGNVSVAALSQNRKRLKAGMSQDSDWLLSFERLKAELEREVSTVKV